MKPSSVCLLVLLACTVSAQEISTGKCPNISVIQNFEPQRYLGRWFEYSNYFAIFQLFGDCVTADYSDVSEPETDESLVSSRISRESRGFQSLSLSLDLENRPSKVSVSVSISKIGLLKSQSQSRSRIRGFQSLSLSLDLVIAIGPCLWTLLQNSY